MSLLSFSQKNSIRRVTVNKDTGAFVPMNKVKEINKILIDLDECKVTNDTLNNIIRNYDIAYNRLDSSLQFKKNELSKKDSIMFSYEKINKNNEILLNRKEWEIKILKVQRNILIPVLGILTIVLLLN
jgi:hypothetical protein